MLIKKGSEYANARAQAERSPQEMRDAAAQSHASLVGQPMQGFKGATVGPSGGLSRIAQYLPQTSVEPSSGSGLAGGKVITSTPLYYDPRWTSIAKQYYPRTESEADAIWEHLYTTDPVLAVCVDSFSDLSWSDFDLLGVDHDKYVKHVYEAMLSEVNLQIILPEATREFLKKGKAIMGLIYDEAKGHFVGVVFYNPTYIRLQVVPLPGHDPIMDLMPTPEQQQFIRSNDPRIRWLQQKLPIDLRQRILTGWPIPLDPVSVSYLARKTSPYAVKGTSIFSRVFDTVMLGDYLCLSSNTHITRPDGSRTHVTELREGDKLIDKDGLTQEVEAIWETQATQLTKLTLYGGTTIEVTPEHKLPVRPVDSVNITKLEAQALRKGDFLMIPRKFTPSGDADVTVERANQLGAYLATSRPSSDLTIQSWLEAHGGAADALKRLSEEAMGWELKYKQALLATYLTERNWPKLKLGEQPTVLACQLWLILAQLGLYGEADDYEGMHVWADPDYVYVRIEELDTVPYNGPVYGIAVSNTHSYTIEGFGSYNSNATIATAQRQAAPLKIFKLGDPQHGWVPTQADADALAVLLASAETDALANIIYHYGLCLSQSTQISLSDATRKPVTDIKIGDRLMGGGYGGEPVQVTAAQELPYEGELLHIKVNGLPETLEVTPEHKLPAILRTQCYSGCNASRHCSYCNTVWSEARKTAKTSWVEAKDLHVGDFLVAPSDTPRKASPITPDIARLLGYYLAEGFTQVVCRRAIGGVRFVMHSIKDKDYIADIRRIVEYGGCNVKEYVHGASKVTTILSIHSPIEEATSLGVFLADYGGQGSTDKKLAEVVFTWAPELQIELLRGHFRGDGCITRNGPTPEPSVVYVQTSSKDLAHQVIRLLQINGFAPYMSIEGQEHSNYRSKTPGYRIKLYGQDAERMADLVAGKQLKPAVHKQFPKVASLNGWVQYRIESIERVPYKGPVYNIECSGSKFYLANGLSSHNSVEYVGVADRLMSVTREWDYLEKVKLMAMGISRAFVTGESSFSSAVAGIQIMTERMRALRQRFEYSWIYPKLLRQTAKMNEFYLRTKAEIDHRIRVTHPDADLVIPTIKWKKALDPTVDTSLLSVWERLFDLGIISERTLAAGAGIEVDTERHQRIEEQAYKYNVQRRFPKLFSEMGGGEEPGAGLPHGAARIRRKAALQKLHHVASDVIDSRIWDKEGRFEGVDYREVEPIIELFKEGTTGNPDWSDLGSEHLGWDAVDQRLIDLGFTDKAINSVRTIVAKELNSQEYEDQRLEQANERIKDNLPSPLVVSGYPDQRRKAAGNDLLPG